MLISGLFYSVSFDSTRLHKYLQATPSPGWMLAKSTAAKRQSLNWTSLHVCHNIIPYTTLFRSAEAQSQEIIMVWLQNTCFGRHDHRWRWWCFKKNVCTSPKKYPLARLELWSSIWLQYLLAVHPGDWSRICALGVTLKESCKSFWRTQSQCFLCYLWCWDRVSCGLFVSHTFF